MNWYCLHTKPLREEAAAGYLRDMLGMETYFPRIRRPRMIRRVRRIVVQPLFPRYLFCRFDPAFQYRAARYASDVIDVVRCGDEPAIVPEEIINQLQTWASPTADVPTIEHPLKSGDVVTIVDGPMRGLQAVILQERAASDRVAILLATLQCHAPVIISRHHLERAS